MSTELINEVNRICTDLRKFSDERRQECAELSARVQTVEQIVAKHQQEGTMHHTTTTEPAVDSTLRDQEGNRIGTVLSANVSAGTPI